MLNLLIKKSGKYLALVYQVIRCFDHIWNCLSNRRLGSHLLLIAICHRLIPESWSDDARKYCILRKKKTIFHFSRFHLNKTGSLGVLIFAIFFLIFRVISFLYFSYVIFLLHSDKAFCMILALFRFRFLLFRIYILFYFPFLFVFSLCSFDKLFL